MCVCVCTNYVKGKRSLDSPERKIVVKIDRFYVEYLMMIKVEKRIMT